MKKHLCLFLILLVCCTAFMTSCFNLVPGEDSLKDAPYELFYLSNGDRTCTVRAITSDPNHSQPYTLTIPKRSPSGDKVVSINLTPLDPFPEQVVGGAPVILREEDYEKLCNQMKENGISDFEYRKFTAYYIKFEVSDKSDQKTKEILEQFPFLSDIGDAYLFDFYVSAEESARLNAIFESYTDWNSEKTQKYYADLKKECMKDLQRLYEANEQDFNPEPVAEIVFPETLISIGEGSFANFVNVTNISFPESLTFIGEGAFSGCIGLTNITIPAGVTWIGEGAFVGCESLSDIAVADENENYYSESNCLIETETKEVILGCSKSVIPDGIKSIKKEAFSGCKGLTEVTIPDSVASIGDYAFRDCTALESLSFAVNCSVLVKDGAFAGCTELTDVTIPKNSSGWNRAFEGCTGLRSATLLAQITGHTFENCINLAQLTFGEDCYIELDPYVIGSILYQIEDPSEIWHADHRLHPMYQYDENGDIVLSPTGEPVVQYYWVDQYLPIETVNGGILKDGIYLRSYDALTTLAFSSFEGDFYMTKDVLLQKFVSEDENISDFYQTVWINRDMESLDLQVFLDVFTNDIEMMNLMSFANARCQSLTTLHVSSGLESLIEYIPASLTDIYYEGDIRVWLNGGGRYFGDSCTIHCADGDITKELGDAMNLSSANLQAYTQLYSMLAPYLNDMAGLAECKATYDALLAIKSADVYESYEQYSEAEEGTAEYDLYREYLEFRTAKSRYNTNKNRRLNDLLHMYNYYGKIAQLNLSVDEQVNTYLNVHLPLLMDVCDCTVEYQEGREGDLTAVTNMDQLPSLLNDQIRLFAVLLEEGRPRTPDQAKAIFEQAKAAMIEPGYITEQEFADRITSREE